MHLKLFPLKNIRTNLNLLITTTQCYLPLIMPLVKGDKKKQSTKIQKQLEAIIINNKHEEPL